MVNFLEKKLFPLGEMFDLSPFSSGSCCKGKVSDIQSVGFVLDNVPPTKFGMSKVYMFQYSGGVILNKPR